MNAPTSFQDREGDVFTLDRIEEGVAYGHWDVNPGRVARFDARLLGGMTHLSPTYDELVARLHKASDVKDECWRRMLACTPGTAEGRRWARAHREAETKASELHREVRRHPDAPPAG